MAHKEEAMDAPLELLRKMLEIYSPSREEGELAALMERGVLALSAGSTVMRFLPPLVISREELDAVVEAIEAVLEGETG